MPRSTYNNKSLFFLPRDIQIFHCTEKNAVEQNKVTVVLLDSRLDEALFERGADSVAHDGIFSVTDGGGALDMLHASNTACTHSTVFA